VGLDYEIIFNNKSPLKKTFELTIMAWEKTATVLFLLAIFMSLSSHVTASNIEIDKTGTVASVRDGDTFTMASGDKIRLADIDAPELDVPEPGAYAARNYLNSLIYLKTVYLDVDSGEMSYDRLVCMAYADYNSTHYINVNHAMVSSGYAEIWDHQNDFSPSNWALYIEKEGQPSSNSSNNTWLYILIFVIVVIIAVVGVFKIRR